MGMGLGDLHLHELPGMGFALVDQHPAIHLGSLAFQTPLQKMFRFGAHTLAEDRGHGTHPGCIARGGDFFLHGHDLFPALFLRLLGNIVVQVAGGGVLLMAIDEGTHVIETGLADERQHLEEIVLGLAGEPDDHGGANGNAGDEPADALQQAKMAVGRTAAAHAGQDAAGSMLQGDIDIGGDVGPLAHEAQKVVLDLVGVNIEEAHPFQRLDVGQCGQQLARAVSQAEIGSVVKGRTVTAESIAEIDAKDWPLARFEPTTKQIGGSLGLVVAGLLVTLTIARYGGDD